LIAPPLEFMHCLCFLLGLHRGFLCHHFPSFVERREPCRCTSGSTGVARLAPCPICFPLLPARYALGVGERCGEWLASRWRTIAPLRLKPHQRLAPSSSALPHEPINQVLSREGPQGSLPAFASGDVAEMLICLTQPVSPLLPRSLRFLPDVISAPPSDHLAVDFPFAGSDTDLSCSVGKTR
jgi:hypothetical protein